MIIQTTFRYLFIQRSISMVGWYISAPLSVCLFGCTPVMINYQQEGNPKEIPINVFVTCAEVCKTIVQKIEYLNPNGVHLRVWCKKAKHVFNRQNIYNCTYLHNVYSPLILKSQSDKVSKRHQLLKTFPCVFRFLTKKTSIFDDFSLCF